MPVIDPKDRDILRNLANRQMEQAQSETNRQNIRDWLRHNTRKGGRPMVHLELNTFSHEVIPPLLQCTGEEARQIESSLYANFVNLAFFGDDRPVLDFYPIRLSAWMQPFGLEVERTHSHNSQNSDLGHKFTYYIQDLERDFDKLKPGKIHLNEGSLPAQIDFVNDIFGDILPAKRIATPFSSCPTQHLVHIMGMETLYLSMYDHEELFHEMMRRLTDDILAFFHTLENKNLLMPTVGLQWLGQGTWCYTDELPTEGENLRTTDLWGYMDSQETVAVSPAMFEEFIWPYYKEIAASFGLLSYGCCEPIHPIWHLLSTMPNLRKVSISPWCDQAFMAERLAGSKVIFHRKPDPTFLGVGTNLDEDALRKHLKETKSVTQHCTVEITQRDVYSINHDVSKARRYIEIIRDVFN